MNTEDTTQPPRLSPEQLRTDMDTIRNVLAEGQRENEVHRTIIAGANLVCGALFLIAIPFVVFGTAIPTIVVEEGPGTYVPALAGLLVCGVLLCCAAPFLLAGWGLFRRKSWGSIAAVVAAVINLLNIPVGTALAVYTFWAVSQRKLGGEAPVAPGAS